MMEWQPIETAPRDGTRVLLGYEGAADYDICVWHAALGNWFNEYSHPVPITPTHWMPLPDPPPPHPSARTQKGEER